MRVTSVDAEWSFCRIGLILSAMLRSLSDENLIVLQHGILKDLGETSVIEEVLQI